MLATTCWRQRAGDDVLRQHQQQRESIRIIECTCFGRYTSVTPNSATLTMNPVTAMMTSHRYTSAAPHLDIEQCIWLLRRVSAAEREGQGTSTSNKAIFKSPARRSISATTPYSEYSTSSSGCVRAPVYVVVVVPVVVVVAPATGPATEFSRKS
jgi:hypothetical protein